MPIRGCNSWPAVPFTNLELINSPPTPINSPPTPINSLPHPSIHQPHSRAEDGGQPGVEIELEIEDEKEDRGEFRTRGTDSHPEGVNSGPEGRGLRVEEGVEEGVEVGDGRGEGERVEAMEAAEEAKVYAQWLPPYWLCVKHILSV
jgi:hypothetical protein